MGEIGDGAERHEVIVIGGVDHDGGAGLLGLGNVFCFFGGLFGLGKDWEQNCGQDGDNGNNH